MSAVNEWVVREYFEMQGYLVAQPQKYIVAGRHKSAEEEIGLIAFNPHVKEHAVPDRMVWTGEDLKTVARAVVGVRGWHTERFYVSTVEQMPEILRFADREARDFAEQCLGTDSMARILCLPKLPASGDLKSKTIRLLKDRGIDGVISFGTMLRELVKHTEKNRNYEKSDLLQVIRILKSYDLLKENQLELFEKRKRNRKKR